jgi:hypothetical protein
MNDNNYIRTFPTHTLFNPLNPRHQDIHITDIAHSLSHICRWAGHIPTFYSVGLHSIHVSLMVHPEHQLAALLHDASEAYLGDLAKPIKRGMPEYQAAEHRLMTVISEVFGFQWPLHDEVHQADAAAMYAEAIAFERDEDIPIIAAPVEPVWKWNFGWGELYPMKTTRQVFLNRFTVLQDEKIASNHGTNYASHKCKCGNCGV